MQLDYSTNQDGGDTTEHKRLRIVSRQVWISRFHLSFACYLVRARSNLQVLTKWVTSHLVESDHFWQSWIHLCREIKHVFVSRKAKTRNTQGTLYFMNRCCLEGDWPNSYNSFQLRLLSTSSVRGFSRVGIILVLMDLFINSNSIICDFSFIAQCKVLRVAKDWQPFFSMRRCPTYLNCTNLAVVPVQYIA